MSRRSETPHVSKMRDRRATETGLSNWREAPRRTKRVRLPIHSGKPTGFGREIAGPTGDSTHPEEQVEQEAAQPERRSAIGNAHSRGRIGFQLPCDLNVFRYAATRGLQSEARPRRTMVVRHPNNGRLPESSGPTCNRWATRRQTISIGCRLQSGRSRPRGIPRPGSKFPEREEGRAPGAAAKSWPPGCSFSGLSSPDHLTQRSRSVERRATDQKYDPERWKSRCFGKRQRVLEASLREPCGSGNRIQPAAFRATRKKVIADQLRFESYPYRNNCQSKTRREYRLDA